MEFISTANIVVVVFLFAFWLGALSYVVGAIFSRTARKRIAAHPYLFGLWFLVAVFLGVLAFFPDIGPPHTHPVLPRAQVMILSLDTACKAYYAEYGSYPAGDNAAIVRQFRGDNPHKTVFLEVESRDLSSSGEVIDPWGTPYKFELRGGKPPVIRSAGPDRVFGDEDDLVTPETVDHAAKSP